LTPQLAALAASVVCLPPLPPPPPPPLPLVKAEGGAAGGEPKKATEKRRRGGPRERLRARCLTVCSTPSSTTNGIGIFPVVSVWCVIGSFGPGCSRSSLPVFLDSRVRNRLF
jgi:hypothetical protein